MFYQTKHEIRLTSGTQNTFMDWLVRKVNVSSATGDIDGSPIPRAEPAPLDIYLPNLPNGQQFYL